MVKIGQRQKSLYVLLVWLLKVLKAVDEVLKVLLLT